MKDYVLIDRKKFIKLVREIDWDDTGVWETMSALDRATVKEEEPKDDTIYCNTCGEVRDDESNKPCEPNKQTEVIGRIGIVYSCDLCGEQFNSTDDLHRHKLRLSDERN